MLRNGLEHRSAASTCLLFGCPVVLWNSGYSDPFTEHISEPYGPEGSVVTKRIDYIAGPPRLVSRYNLDRFSFHSLQSSRTRNTFYPVMSQDEARTREQWQPVLELILALSNELHPATGLKTEAERLWNRLGLGPIPAIPKTERAKTRELFARQQRRRRGRP